MEDTACIMAEHADGDDFDGDIFIYRGGRAPQHITHVLIDESVDEIEEEAFDGCENLLTLETHDGLRRVGKYAFRNCKSLRRINLKSTVEIDERAFYECENLESVEFGDRLETIGVEAFAYCTSLMHLKLPSIITIGQSAFWKCKCITYVELSGRLQTIGASAFYCCERLQRIAIPLKRDLFEFNEMMQRYNHFRGCEQLITVDLVGGIRQTVASLYMEGWRTEMIAEINRINQILPTIADEKTAVIKEWINLVMEKLRRYVYEHCRYVREGITLLELALWKAKLGEKEVFHQSWWGSLVTHIWGEGRKKKVKVDAASARKESRITCGADIVIKNVLPFLQLVEDNPRVKASYGEEVELNDFTHGGGCPPIIEIDIQHNVMNETLNDDDLSQCRSVVSEITVPAIMVNREA